VVVAVQGVGGVGARAAMTDLGHRSSLTAGGRQQSSHSPAAAARRVGCFSRRGGGLRREDYRSAGKTRTASAFTLGGSVLSAFPSSQTLTRLPTVRASTPTAGTSFPIWRCSWVLVVTTTAS